MLDPKEKLTAKKPTYTTDSNLATSEPYKIEFSKTMQLYVERSAALDTNLAKLYSLVWGQLTDGLQARVKGNPDFEDKDDDGDVLWLLETIKLCIRDIDHTSNKFRTVATTMRQFFSLQQTTFYFSFL